MCGGLKTWRFSRICLHWSKSRCHCCCTYLDGTTWRTESWSKIGSVGRRFLWNGANCSGYEGCVEDIRTIHFVLKNSMGCTRFIHFFIIYVLRYLPLLVSFHVMNNSYWGYNIYLCYYKRKVRKNSNIKRIYEILSNNKLCWNLNLTWLSNKEMRKNIEMCDKFAIVIYWSDINIT